MPYVNPLNFLIDATKYPVALEAALPAGAPVISTMLLDIANGLPVLPDFVMELPDLPAPPVAPTPPGDAVRRAGIAAARRPYVTGVTVTPVRPRPAASPTPTIARKPLGQEILS